MLILCANKLCFYFNALFQNRTNSDQLDDDDDETVCKNDCHIKQVRIIYKIVTHLRLQPKQSL